MRKEPNIDKKYMRENGMISKRFLNDGKPGIYLNSVQRNALYHFTDWMESKEIQFETYPCECGCKQEQLIPIAEKDRYGIAVSTKICPKCGLIMTNPRMKQENYNKFYDTLYRQLYVGRSIASEEYYNIQCKRGNDILEYLQMYVNIDNVQSVLEIGCSSGGIVSVFKDYGIAKCKGIDLGSEYIQYGRSKGLDLKIGSSDKLVESGEKYDLIIINHVLEHFLDIRKELLMIKELLTENGIVYISVPGVFNLQSVYGNDFLKYLQNAHIRHFCRGTLQQIMAWNGFEEICGDEEVRGVYKKGCVCKKIMKNYYHPEMDYLNDLENGNIKEIYIAPINIEAQKAGYNIEILNQWLMLARKGKRVSYVLEEKQINNIAIYGGGILGRQLYEELADSSIKVMYFIDRNKNVKIKKLKTYTLNEALPQTEAIVIATSNEYTAISHAIRTIGGGVKILTIQDLLNEMVTTKTK